MKSSTWFGTSKSTHGRRFRKATIPSEAEFRTTLLPPSSSAPSLSTQPTTRLESGKGILNTSICQNTKTPFARAFLPNCWERNTPTRRKGGTDIRKAPSPFPSKTTCSRDSGRRAAVLQTRNARLEWLATIHSALQGDVFPSAARTPGSSRTSR